MRKIYEKGESRLADDVKLKKCLSFTIIGMYIQYIYGLQKYLPYKKRGLPGLLLTKGTGIPG